METKEQKQKTVATFLDELYRIASDFYQTMPLIRKTDAAHEIAHPPVVLSVDPAGDLRALPIPRALMEHPATKAQVAGMLPVLVERGALLAALVLEAWMVKRKIGEGESVDLCNTPRPSECADRVEVLAVSGMLKDGSRFSYYFTIERVEGQHPRLHRAEDAVIIEDASDPKVFLGGTLFGGSKPRDGSSQH